MVSVRCFLLSFSILYRIELAERKTSFTPSSMTGSSFSILYRIELAERAQYLLYNRWLVTFSILYRIELAESRSFTSNPVAHAPFSILYRIELAESAGTLNVRAAGDDFQYPLPDRTC